ncbi:MAG: hypothetical protein AB7I42_24025 [Bradyrhizobium sp.]|uniref:hypothetical protein n=1 Tax=Bradyrhizobium sp. TaxID=376 RepID=UPI003D0B5242
MSETKPLFCDACNTKRQFDTHHPDCPNQPSDPKPPGTPRPVEKLTCPHCSHTQEPPQEETYFDEDEFPDILCQACGAYFDAVVEVSIAWRTMKRERFDE